MYLKFKKPSTHYICLILIGIGAVFSVKGEANRANNDNSKRTANNGKSTFLPFNENLKSNLAQKLSSDIKSIFENRNYSWILHVHFHGNNTFKKDKAPRKTRLIDNVNAQKLPFVVTELPKNSAPRTAEFSYKTKALIGSIEYEYRDGMLASNSIDALYNCGSEIGKEKLQKTLFIVTGSSHGADALDYFTLKLEKKCGKKVDIALFSDGIVRPLWLPKTKLINPNLAGKCYSFYQNSGGLLDGSAIEGCINYELDVSHIDASKEEKFAKHFYACNYTDLLVKISMKILENQKWLRSQAE